MRGGLWLYHWSCHLRPSGSSGLGVSDCAALLPSRCASDSGVCCCTAVPDAPPAGGACHGYRFHNLRAFVRRWTPQVAHAERVDLHAVTVNMRLPRAQAAAAS